MGQPAVNNTEGAPVTDPFGQPGFPGFDAAYAKNTLGYLAQMQEAGIPVTWGYISDAHDNHTSAFPAPFNPNFPRACFSRFCQTQRVVDNVNLALAEALPQKVTGGNSAGIHFCAYAGFDESLGEYWLYLEVNEGSYGGRFGKDAMDSVDNLMANTRNNPIEELDMRFPVRCDQYELRPEPAAPGKWRGGIGIIRRNRFLVDGIYSCEGDRQTDPPRGIFGGWDGLVASCRKNPDTAQEQVLDAKVTGVPFAAGEFIEFREPNAAGYGDPLERDPDAVRSDIADGHVSRESARRDYDLKETR
jgi:N-methylhydantoinase B/oxoprolinase/acetone carboxylase alpha subunit